MTDPASELDDFLRGHGVGPWVFDGLGRAMRREDWVAAYVQSVVEAYAEDDTERADQLRELVAEIKPGQKSVAVSKIRKIVD